MAAQGVLCTRLCCWVSRRSRRTRSWSARWSAQCLETGRASWRGTGSRSCPEAELRVRNSRRSCVRPTETSNPEDLLAGRAIAGGKLARAASYTQEGDPTLPPRSRFAGVAY